MSTLCDAHLIEKINQLISQMTQLQQMKQNLKPTLEALAQSIAPADLANIKGATPSAPPTDISSIIQTVLCSGLQGNLSCDKTDPGIIVKNFTQSCMSQIMELSQKLESAFSGTQNQNALAPFRQAARQINQIVGSPVTFSSNMSLAVGNLNIRIGADPTTILNNPIFGMFNNLRGVFGGLFSGLSDNAGSLLGACSACDAGMDSFQDQGCSGTSMPETGNTVPDHASCSGSG